MSKKLTIKFIKSEFKKEGYQLLTKEYKNSFQKLEYICSKGHKGFISWSNFQQKHRCHKCFCRKKRLSIKFIKLNFEKEGYQLLTKEYKNAYQKLEYICPKGHKGHIAWRGFYQKQRCRKCFVKNNKGKNHPQWKGGISELNIPLYDTYAHQISWCEKVRRDPNNSDYLQVKCTESGCREWFTPTIKQVQHRIEAINLISGGKRFYCSEECKRICSIFNQIKYPKGFKHDYSREVQKELAELVLKRDNHECQRCENEENLQAHHYESIYFNPVMSADIEMCVTLCKKCHKLAHKDFGCRPYDLTKNNLCKEE